MSNLGGVGWFDSRRWWTILCLIPFTTTTVFAFCAELQKAEFERNVIRKHTLAGDCATITVANASQLAFSSSIQAKS